MCILNASAHAMHSCPYVQAEDVLFLQADPNGPGIKKGEELFWPYKVLLTVEYSGGTKGSEEVACCMLHVAC